MRLLLDSHAFLWWLMNDRRLGPAARTALSQAAAPIHVSAASIWEIGIKARLGRLDLGDRDMVAALEDEAFLELPVTARHAHAAALLPRHHDDPFDRMLVAQALLESLTLVTRDEALEAYGVATLW